MFILFKGENGAGKTVGAASFPDPIILDFDKKGSAVVKKHFPEKTIPYHQFGDVMQAGDLLERWDKEGCPFQTIVVDSLTSLSYDCIKTLDTLKGQTILTTLRDSTQNMRKSGKGYKMPELRGYDYYNIEDSFLKFYIDGLKTMHAVEGKNPKNVIIIAHVMTSESTDIKTKEVTKTRRILTAGQKIAAYVPAQFDEVFHFGVSVPNSLDSESRVSHLVFTEAIGDDFAKTAYQLPYKIDFTNKSLYDLIRNEVDPNSSETQKETTSKTAKPRLNF